jgi:hypothetical protein
MIEPAAALLFLGLGSPAVNPTETEWRFFYMCLTQYTLTVAMEVLLMPMAGCKLQYNIAGSIFSLGKKQIFWLTEREELG